MTVAREGRKPFRVIGPDGGDTLFNAEDAENRRESQRGFINLRSSATLRVLCVKSIASAIRTRVPVARLRTVCILAAVKRILRRASLAGLGLALMLAGGTGCTSLTSPILSEKQI